MDYIITFIWLIISLFITNCINNIIPITRFYKYYILTFIYVGLFTAIGIQGLLFLLNYEGVSKYGGSVYNFRYSFWS